jgi:hypothetical protein
MGEKIMWGLTLLLQLQILRKAIAYMLNYPTPESFHPKTVYETTIYQRDDASKGEKRTVLNF